MTGTRLLRRGQPIWLDGPSHSTRRYPALSGTRLADVAIVGGGITGALVAQMFAAADARVALLERARVGEGSTAASSALLLQEPDAGLIELERRYGRRNGRRLWQMSHDSVAQLVALLRHLRVPCELSCPDAVYYATQPGAVEQLAREFERRKRAGFGGAWLSPAELRRITAIPAEGAVRTRGSAQFDPYKACVGVMRAAATAGAEVFERSPVIGIDSARDGVRVRTRHGAVQAKRVVIATGYATPSFRPLAGRFRMYRTYVLATAPMTPSQRRDLGLSDVMLWDTERPYHYARWTKDHRLLLGGADRPVRPGQRRDTQFRLAARKLREYFDRLLPALRAIETAQAWEGLFAMTADTLPYIGPHRRYPGHWFALGYGGNGMTFAFLAAKLLLERWQGVESPDHALFGFDR